MNLLLFNLSKAAAAKAKVAVAVATAHHQTHGGHAGHIKLQSDWRSFNSDVFYVLNEDLVQIDGERYNGVFAGIRSGEYRGGKRSIFAVQIIQGKTVYSDRTIIGITPTVGYDPKPAKWPCIR